MDASCPIRVLRCEVTPTEERIFYELGGGVGCFIPAIFIEEANREMHYSTCVKRYLEGDYDFPEFEFIEFVESFFCDGLPIFEPEHKIGGLEDQIAEKRAEIEQLQEAINIVRSGMFETKREWLQGLINKYDDGISFGDDQPPRATLGLTPMPERRAPDRLRRRELKSIILKLAERDGCKLHETVPSERVQKWVRELARLGLRTNENSVRAILSRYGYAVERKGER